MPQFHIPHPTQAVAVERLGHSAEQVRGAASSVTGMCGAGITAACGCVEAD